jgi:hypothetical protein
MYELTVAPVDKEFERSGQFGMLNHYYGMVESTAITMTGFEHTVLSSWC